MNSKEIRNVSSELIHYQQRLIMAYVCVVILLLALLLRMAWLQVWRGSDLRAQAENNRITWVPKVPQRGHIVDRHGLILASNKITHTLEITPNETPDLQTTLNTLKALVNISEQDEKRFMQQMREHRKPSEPIELKFTLSDQEMAKIAVRLYQLPGVQLQTKWVRHYPYEKMASHALGYIAKINTREKALIREWPEARQTNYRGTQYIGKAGIEYQYESVLHGQSGFEQVETTANRQPVRTLNSTPATAGSDVFLTLDASLQKTIEEAFGNRRGAAIALHPQTGEILALVSMPTFDPNLFVAGIDQNVWEELNSSPDRPLFNRALRGTYPPGSTYKPFMGLLALESGIRHPAAQINDPGYWMFGNHRFRSHGDHSLGLVNLHESIVHSSNVYYYTLAHELGVDAIYRFMKRLGFGEKTGIDLPEEASGLLPNKEWKEKAFRQPQQKIWFDGETISLGIGQGYNHFSMLQLASATALIANGGYRITPHLMQRIEGKTPTPPSAVGLGLNSEHIQLIRQAMADVPIRGTSAGAFIGAPYTSAGKTGTAQAKGIKQNQKYNAARLAESWRDHSLYIGFAPVENPQVAVAIIVENAGTGAAYAAPIARKIFDYLLVR